MKRIKLLSIALLFGALAAVPVFSAAETDATKPAEKHDPRVNRKITVKLVGGSGTVVSEATVPAIETDGEFRSVATVLTSTAVRRIVEINCGSSEFYVSVTEPDRPSVVNGPEGKGLSVGTPLELFRVSTLYSGPGDYEVYRAPGERMMVTVQ